MLGLAQLWFFSQLFMQVGWPFDLVKRCMFLCGEQNLLIDEYVCEIRYPFCEDEHAEALDVALSSLPIVQLFGGITKARAVDVPSPYMCLIVLMKVDWIHIVVDISVILLRSSNRVPQTLSFVILNLSFYCWNASTLMKRFIFSFHSNVMNSQYFSSFDFCK
jgi:hypothetical protein